MLDAHFQHITTSSEPSQYHDLLAPVPPCITELSNESLLSILDAAAIRATPSKMLSWKAPGYDVFQIGFYKHSEELVEHSLVTTVQDFFRTHKLDLL